MSMGLEISEELITARRDCFWSAFASDCISSMYIGRSTTFKPDVIDVIPPPVVPELDFEAPLYRSSAFHWSSRLIFIASKIMDSVYTLKPGISLAMRQAKVPELHLLLESWCVSVRDAGPRRRLTSRVSRARVQVPRVAVAPASERRGPAKGAAPAHPRPQHGLQHDAHLAPPTVRRPSTPSSRFPPSSSGD
jgi:hypothetical protein